MGKTEEIKIEAMKVSELEQVLEIEKASFSLPWSRTLFLSELSKQPVSTLLVAVESEGAFRRVIGYIVFWTVADEIHILNLATSPPFRRMGIATRLVLAALGYGYAKGACKAHLEVRASNAAAQKLYEGLGFSTSFVRKNYYDMPIEDAVVMTLEEKAFQNLVNDSVV